MLKPDERGGEGGGGEPRGNRERERGEGRGGSWRMLACRNLRWTHLWRLEKRIGTGGERGDRAKSECFPTEFPGERNTVGRVGELSRSRGGWSKFAVSGLIPLPWPNWWIHCDPPRRRVVLEDRTRRRIGRGFSPRLSRTGHTWPRKRREEWE